MYSSVSIYLSNMYIYIYFCGFACAGWGPFIRLSSKTSWLLQGILPATGEDFVRSIMSHKHLKVNRRSFGTPC